jgi:Na+/H+-dicarboxylate symporter
MEAGEIGGALLFVLAAVSALAVAVSTGAVDFTRPLTGTLLSPFLLSQHASRRT